MLRSSLLLLLAAVGCSQPAASKPDPPKTEALVEPAHERPKTAVVRPMEIVELRSVEKRSWQTRKLDKPQVMLDATEPEEGWKLNRPLGRLDRILATHGKQTRLFDGAGRELGRWDNQVIALSERWAVLGDQLYARQPVALDLDDGSTVQIEIANLEEVAATLHDDFKGRLFATGDRLWWKTNALEGEPTWFALADGGKPVTAEMVSDAGVPLQSPGTGRAARFHEASEQLLMVAAYGCSLMTFGLKKGGGCLLDEDIGGFVVAGDRAFPLATMDGAFVHIPSRERRTLQTPCELMVIGAHDATGNVLYRCESPAFGVYTPENEFLEIPEDAIGPLWAVPLHPDLPRFAAVASNNDKQNPIELIVDMRGTGLRVPGKLLESGQSTGFFQREDEVVLADFEARTVETFDPPCEGNELSIHHVGTDRFVVRCTKLDPEGLKGLSKRALRDALRIESQAVVDVEARSIYSVDGYIRLATDDVIIVGTGAKSANGTYPGPGLAAYRLPQ